MIVYAKSPESVDEFWMTLYLNVFKQEKELIL